jgi:hypothetical protein
MVQWEIKETRVLQGNGGLGDRLVTKEQQVNKVQKVKKEAPVILELKVIKVHKGHKESPEIKD